MNPHMEPIKFQQRSMLRTFHYIRGKASDKLKEKKIKALFG